MNHYLKYLCLIMALPLAVKAFNQEELSTALDEVRGKAPLTFESYQGLDTQIKDAGRALVGGNEDLTKVQASKREVAVTELKGQANAVLGKMVDTIRSLSGMERVEDNTGETKKVGWRVKKFAHTAKAERFNTKTAALDTEVRGLEEDVATKKAENSQALTVAQAERDAQLQELDTAWGAYKAKYEAELAALEAALEKEKSEIQGRFSKSKEPLGENDEAALAGLNKREIEAMEAAEAKNKKAVLELNKTFAEKKAASESDMAKSRENYESKRTELLATLEQDLKMINGQISEKKKEAERLRINAAFWGSYYKPGEHGLAFETSRTYGSAVAGWTLGFAGTDPYYWPVPMADVTEELGAVNQLVLMPFQSLLKKEGYAGYFVDENGNDELPVLLSLIEKAKNFQSFIAKVGKVAEPARTIASAAAAHESGAAAGGQRSTGKKKVTGQQGKKGGKNNKRSPWAGMMEHK